MLAMKQKLVVTWADPSTDAEAKRSGADETVYALKGFSYSALSAHTVDELAGLSAWSVLVNRLFAQDEMEKLKALLLTLSKTDVAYVYFADAAVYRLAPNSLQTRLIYRPETLVTSLMEVQWWLQRGIAFAAVSPLVTLEELQTIVHSDKRVEISIHGRLLQSVSRRKLLSAYGAYAGVSYPFTKTEGLTIMETKRPYRFPIYEQEEGTLIYTDFVQESFADIRSLAAAGRFFVESVTLPKEEVKEALSIYRSLLQGKQPDYEAFRRRYAHTGYSRGYYGQKTIL